MVGLKAFISWENVIHLHGCITERIMDTSTRSAQTAFRFKPGMLGRMKAKARLMGLSLNSYVENLIETDLKNGDPYGSLFKEISMLQASDTFPFDFPKPEQTLEFSEEELDKDPRLSYLVNKHLR